VPGRIHNNCSGKHAGMLALALHGGVSPQGYEAPDHPVQRRILQEVSRWCEVEASRVGLGVDGCGVPCFAVPLAAAARGLARFSHAAETGETGPRAILEAMAGHPVRVAGAGRLDTELLARAGDRVVSKVGAEGVHVAILRNRGLAVAIKAEDGARRASGAVLVEVLSRLGVLDPGEEEELRGAFVHPVVNTRGERVGRLRVELELGGGRRGAGRPPRGGASSDPGRPG
jgi:L-asparaginase II